MHNFNPVCLLNHFFLHKKKGYRYGLMVCIITPLLACTTPLQKPNEALVASDQEVLNTQTVAPHGLNRFMGIFSPYRITIQQGNFVSKEMADKLVLGMPREAVQRDLGTPLLTDIFHRDRWDYIFRLMKPNGVLTTSRVTVYFNNDLVSRIEKGTLPLEKEYLNIITSDDQHINQ